MKCAPSEGSDRPGHPPSLISLRCALYGSLRIKCFFRRTVKTDQTVWMASLSVFAGRTGQFVGFLVLQLIVKVLMKSIPLLRRRYVRLQLRKKCLQLILYQEKPGHYTAGIKLNMVAWILFGRKPDPPWHCHGPSLKHVYRCVPPSANGMAMVLTDDQHSCSSWELFTWPYISYFGTGREILVICCSNFRTVDEGLRVSDSRRLRWFISIEQEVSFKKDICR